jgi:hypothetical protein
MRDFLVIRRGHDDLTANDVVIVDDPRFVAQVGQLLARYLSKPSGRSVRVAGPRSVPRAIRPLRSPGEPDGGGP